MSSLTLKTYKIDMQQVNYCDVYSLSISYDHLDDRQVVTTKLQ